MTRGPSPSPDDLRVLDPDGSFRARLERDYVEVSELSDSHDLERLRRIAHGLAGAAGTFGYGQLGAVAIAVDDKFTEGAVVTAADVARLLAALEQALDPGKSG